MKIKNHMKNKKNIWLYSLIALGFVILFNFSCKKDKNKDTVTDIDGNVYHTVKIGTQTWLVENLKTTKYRNGDPIPNVTTNTEWNNLTTGAYSNYDNNSSYADTYGRLYNWYAVNDSRNIAPDGWHVATDAEWTTLLSEVGSKDKLKESGTAHWQSGNTGNNSSGFTALPGGDREVNGTYKAIGQYGLWYTSTMSGGNPVAQYIPNDNSFLAFSGTNIGRTGCAVRCIKD